MLKYERWILYSKILINSPKIYNRTRHQKGSFHSKYITLYISITNKWKGVKIVNATGTYQNSKNNIYLLDVIKSYMYKLQIGPIAKVLQPLKPIYNNF